MIRNLLATTAIATLFRPAPIAQTTARPPIRHGAGHRGSGDAAETPARSHAEGHLASNIIGENVYNGVADDAENIGTVNDIVLDADGQLGDRRGRRRLPRPRPEGRRARIRALEWAQRDGDRPGWSSSATREQLEHRQSSTAMPMTDG